MPRYDVFLSHASADKPAVEHLARKLREEGLDPFLDIWCLVGGEYAEVHDALLDGSGTTTVGITTAVAVLDSRRVVSGAYDRTLRVWDLESGEVECLFTLDAPVDAVAAIPDCGVIVAGDSSGRVHFFDFVEAQRRPRVETRG